MSCKRPSIVNVHFKDKMWTIIYAENFYTKVPTYSHKFLAQSLEVLLYASFTVYLLKSPYN